MLSKLVFLLLLFLVCLYIVSKSCLQSSHTSEPLSSVSENTHFSLVWHPDYFFLMCCRKKKVHVVLFCVGKTFFSAKCVFFGRGVGGGGQSPGHLFMDENRYIL